MTLSDLKQTLLAYLPEMDTPPKRSAVLLPLAEENGEIYLLYTKRAEGIRQSGDVCFPGGRSEQGETPFRTAVREAKQELAIPPEEITFLTYLPLPRTLEKEEITPVVGLLSAKALQGLTPSPAEVAEVFRVPLSVLLEMEPERYTLYWHVTESDTFPYEKIRNGKQYPFRVPQVEELFYEVDGHIIWGVTARFTASLVSALKTSQIHLN